MPQCPSPVDQQLVDALAARGVEVSCRQARRWREGGQLPKPVRRGLGQPTGGSTVSYTEEAIDQAECLVRCLDEYGSLDEATVVLFWRGYEPRERALKGAYSNLLEGLLKDARKSVSSDEAWAVAESAAGRISRRAAQVPGARQARDRLQQKNRAWRLIDVLTNLIVVLLGGNAKLQQETLLALGIEAIPDLPPEAAALFSASAVSEEAAGVTLPALQKTIKRASLAELRRARSDLAVIREFARTFSAIAIRAAGADLGLGIFADTLDDDLACAQAIPVIALKRKQAGRGFDEGVANLKQFIPALQATNAFADSIPAHWHPYMGPNGAVLLAQAPQTEQEAVLAAMRVWAKDHPKEAALIASLDNSQPEQSN
jgi:hypothetical protein